MFNIYRMSTFTPPNRLAKELNTALFWQEVKKADIFDKLGSPEGLESLILRRAEYLFHDAPKEGRKSRCEWGGGYIGAICKLENLWWPYIVWTTDG